jgi:hypothetical protein
MADEAAAYHNRIRRHDPRNPTENFLFSEYLMIGAA